MPSATIFRLGWTNPQTDAFGAHPQLGPILDLNDGAAFALAFPGGVELPPPPRTILTAGNVRTQGERATRAVYRHNRRVVVRLLAGPMSTYSDLAINIRTLVSWLAAPPAIPFTIQYQPTGASAPVYLDVVGAAHDIPADEDEWLRLQLEPVTLVFLARPGLRGELRADELDGHPRAEALVDPLPHRAHSARPEQAQHAVLSVDELTGERGDIRPRAGRRPAGGAVPWEGRMAHVPLPEAYWIVDGESQRSAYDAVPR